MILVFTIVELVLSSKVMATLRNKRKLAAVSTETQKSAKDSQSQNTFVPGMTEEYITQVSEEIEARVTKKLSQELSRTELHILGALSKLDEFLLNPQVRTCSGTVPEHPGTVTQKTENPLGTVRRKIPIPKWSSIPVEPATRLTQIKRRLLTA